MQLEFEIMHQHIKRTDTEQVVAGSINYLKAHFTFSEEWIGTKVAVFKSRGKSYTTLIDDKNICLIPWEAICSGIMLVSAFCGDLITADSAEVEIKKTGYDATEITKEPTPSLLNQILKKLDEVGKVTIDPADIENQVNKYLEEHPVEAADEEQIVSIIAAYFVERREELKGDKGDTGEKGESGDKGNQGDKGEPGEKGEPGYTPQRGVDYWTNEDIELIDSHIDSKIGGVLDDTY